MEDDRNSIPARGNDISLLKSVQNDLESYPVLARFCDPKDKAEVKNAWNCASTRQASIRCGF
jgi:hypothetical protein